MPVATFFRPSLRLVLAALGLAASLGVGAAPLGFDAGFGAGGKVFANVKMDPSDDDARAVVVQPDGKVVVAGRCMTGTNSAYCIARYQASGLVDFGFGRAGLVTTHFGGGDATARAIVLDGTNIVVAGSCGVGTNTDFCIARYLADGTLDTSFNGTGKVTTPMGTGPDDAWALAMDGTGILVAGECAADGGTKMCLARYMSNGSLDPAYGTGGKVFASFRQSTGFAPGDAARALLVSDGKAYVAGGCSVYTWPSFCVVRLTAGGALDAGFGTGGMTFSEMGTGAYAYPNAIALSGSRILVGGGCSNGSNLDFCMLRVNTSNGAIDLTLAGTGYVRVPVGAGDDVATGMAQSGTVTVLSGHCVAAGLKRFCLTALSETGGVTGTFNGGASLIDTFGTADNFANGLAVVGSGITLAGTCGPSPQRDFCVARYDFNGRDSSFFGTGLRIHDLALTPGYDVLTGLLRQPDGKLLAVGYCLGTNTVLCLARFNTDGSPDPALGGYGAVVEDFGPDASFGKVALDSVNRILVGGVCNGGLDFCVTRYQADGTRDAAFGTAGVASFAMGTGVYPGQVAGLSVTAGDGVVLGSTCYLPGGFSDFCWLKLTASGGLDAAFGTGGRAFAGFSLATASAMAANAAGYLVAGPCTGGGCAARVTPAGVLDTAFGAGSGRILVPGLEAKAVALMGDSIVLGGTCVVSASSEFCLARLLADGSLDATFSGDGIASTPVGPYVDQALALLPDGTGIIAAGGCSTDAGGAVPAICLARFLADGSLDASFDDGGTYMSTLGSASSRVTALVRSGNRVIAGAECIDPDEGDGDFCLAAFALLANDIPRAPTVTSVLAGDAQAQVSFTPPSDNGGSAITQYTATCGARSASGTGSPLTVTLLQNGVAVDCTVTATNVNGTGPASDPPVSVTPRKTVTVSVAVSANPASAGANLTLTATVVGEAPLGLVQFYLDATHFATCDRSLLLGSSSATCTTDQVPAGTWALTVHYAGDTANAPGVSPALSLTVVAGGANLTIVKSGQGTVTSNPAGINCGLGCSASFALGTPVTLTAFPASGFNFSGWSGCDLTSGTTCTVTMSAARSVNASFAAPPVTLVVSKVAASGSGGRVVSAPAAIDCGPTCSADIAYGTALALTPTANAGSMFAGWTGACWGMGNCQVTMDAAKTVTANFSVGVPGNLSLTQSASPSPARSGRDVVYALTVANGGTLPDSVLLVDYTPPGTQFIWASPGCGFASGVVSCDVTVQPGQSVHVKIVVRPTAAGAITNDAYLDQRLNTTSSLTIAVDASPLAAAVLRYRLYSPVTLEHHFTTDLNEYNVLGANGNWNQEGTVGRILDNPGEFNGVTAVPYYRLYNRATQWHHWTTDANEYYTLIQFPDWNAEGVDGWILPTQAPDTIPLYRLLYPFVAGLHHWTIDVNEYNALIGSYGWIGEGGSGFVMN